VVTETAFAGMEAVIPPSGLCRLTTDPGCTTIADGVLYTVDPSGFLTARNPTNGEILARLSLGARSCGGVSADGEAVYVAVGTGQASPGSIIAFGDTSHAGHP